MKICGDLKYWENDTLCFILICFNSIARNGGSGTSRTNLVNSTQCGRARHWRICRSIENFRKHNSFISSHLISSICQNSIAVFRSLLLLIVYANDSYVYFPVFADTKIDAISMPCCIDVNWSNTPLACQLISSSSIYPIVDDSLDVCLWTVDKMVLPSKWRLLRRQMKNSRVIGI